MEQLKKSNEIEDKNKAKEKLQNSAENKKTEEKPDTIIEDTYIPII